jgi:hypothetical protein
VAEVAAQVTDGESHLFLKGDDKFDPTLVDDLDVFDLYRCQRLAVFQNRATDVDHLQCIFDYDIHNTVGLLLAAALRG